MTSSRTLLALPAVAGLLVLSACGSDDVRAGAASASSAVSSAGSAGSSAASSAASSPSSASGGSSAAGIDVEDQSGGGDSMTVARVSAPEAGFVVVRVDDDDRSDDGAVLGSSAVDAGVSTDVAVTLTPPVDGDVDLEATLYADTDGNGSFDEGTDQAVPEPEDGDDDSDDDGDDTDVVDDGAEYAAS